MPRLLCTMSLPEEPSARLVVDLHLTELIKLQIVLGGTVARKQKPASQCECGLVTSEGGFIRSRPETDQVNLYDPKNSWNDRRHAILQVFDAFAVAWFVTVLSWCPSTHRMPSRTWRTRAQHMINVDELRNRSTA